MCRIASTFLLQRLKGSMSGEARDFNNMETRIVFKVFFFFPARQGAEGNSRHSDRNFRATCTIVSHRQNWVVQFKRGDFSTCDAPRPGRPKTVTTPEIIHQIHKLILENRQISAKSIGIAAHTFPKYSECKNRLENFSPRFFGIKKAPSSFIIFQKAKLSTPSVTHLCWCNCRTFWRKNAAGRSQRGSCSCTTMPRLTGHLQSIRNWASIILITHSILRIWPRRTTICSLDWQNNWNVVIFRPTQKSLLPRWPGWKDNLLIFFFLSGLQKLEQRAKKCIELHGEYVE